MGPISGLFTSAIDTKDWVSDPDVPGSEMHELVHADGVWAGMTRILEATEPLTWTPDQRECIVVLEGRVRIEAQGAVVADLGPGDSASLPAGLETTWHLTTPFKEFWVLV